MGHRFHRVSTAGMVKKLETYNRKFPFESNLSSLASLYIKHWTSTHGVKVEDTVSAGWQVTLITYGMQSLVSVVVFCGYPALLLQQL